MKLLRNIRTTIGPHALYIAFAAALISTLGSLYFSEVMDLPPCVLCWYQRIAMYPIVLVLAVGIIKKHSHVWLYALPAAVIGWGIALYHNLLYYKILPEAAAPCKLGISCTTRYIEWLGFLTIPLLALIGFSIIIVSLIIHIYYSNKKESIS